MNYKSIAKTIIDLKDKDLELRQTLLENGQLGEGYNEEMEKLHNSNAAILSNIIDKIGYPTIDKVGKKANDAAWLVIQHSISQPELMRKALRLLKKEVDENKTSPIHLAYLSDRIAVFEGRYQLYGTQFDWDESGQLSPNPFEDIDKVNQRRKSIQLNTLEEQIEMMRKQAEIEHEVPPKNFAQRKSDFDKWRKKVGWIK